MKNILIILLLLILNTQFGISQNSAEKFVGIWAVGLKCVESDCNIAQKGQNLYQEFLIESLGDRVKVQVTNSDNISTTYSGHFDGKTLTLISQIKNIYGQLELSTKYKLKMKNSKTLIGTRETIHHGICTIKYNVRLTK